MSFYKKIPETDFYQLGIENYLTGRGIDADYAKQSGKLSVYKTGWNEAKFKNPRDEEQTIFGLNLKERMIINCDVLPYNPHTNVNGWKIKSHIKHGKLYTDQIKIKLYLTEDQKYDTFVTGSELMLYLENKNVINANVLWFLIENPEYIPNEWKRDKHGQVRNILFPGTIYTNPADLSFIFYLQFSEEHNKWGWGMICLEVNERIYRDDCALFAV